MEIINLISVV